MGKYKKVEDTIPNFRLSGITQVYQVVILLAALISVHGAQNDMKSSKNLETPVKCDPGSKVCDFSNPSPPLMGTPRKMEQKQSDSVVQFISWLFGAPNSKSTSSSSKNSTGSTSSSVDKVKENTNPLLFQEEPSKTTPKTVVYSVPVEEGKGDDDSSNKRNTRQLLQKNNVIITDIQESIGTEVDPSQVNKVNMRYGLTLAEKMEKEAKNATLKKRVRGNVRPRRDSYKPVKVPYVKPTSNPANDFQRRQLLLNPLEQQMAIQAQQQQQQAAVAAAAMLHHQQVLNGQRVASLLDDYDDRDEDDDDSDEDSDEFDDFPRFGPPPLVEHHHMYFRRGVEGPNTPSESEGRQRREDVTPNGKENKKGRRKNKEGRGGAQKNRRNRVGSLKSGHWLLDDYDLHSEFYDRQQERGDLPNSWRENGKLGERIELDEQEHYNQQHNIKNEKENSEHLKHRGDMEYIYKEFRDSLCSDNDCPISRQGEGETESPPESSSTEASSPDSSSTEASSPDSSSTEGEGGDTSSSTTSEAGIGSPLDPSSTSEGSTMEGSSITSGGSSTSLVDLSSTTSGGSSSTIGMDSNSTSSLTPDMSTESSTTTGGTGIGSTTMGIGSNTTDSSSTTEAPSNSTESPKPKPPYKATLNCKCGTQSVRGAGIGDGTVVRFHVNPWLVEIASSEVRGKHLCSGSIINDRYVLTSKSCLKNVASPDTLTVISGLQSKQSKTIPVKNIITNPKADLALLQLKSPIKPSSTVRPICLPIGQRYAGPYSSGNLVTFKKTNARTPIQMVDTEVAILKNDTSCNSKGEDSFCAGPPGSAKCGGDTGGVLMVYRGGYSYEQIGIVSDTVGCRPTSTPGVYTDIRKRTRWILNRTKDGSYCRNPKVTDEDLSSSTRFGDPFYEINEDFDDTSEEEDDRKAVSVSEDLGDVGSEEEEEADDFSTEESEEK